MKDQKSATYFSNPYQLIMDTRAMEVEERPDEAIVTPDTASGLTPIITITI
jgi:hypothetical protein